MRSSSTRPHPAEAAARGTHYTPVNVVDFLLTQVFDDGLFGSELCPEAKVLDLSCGSGVFLVESLRRLIAKRLAAGEKHTRDLVRDVLYNQVYGVDIEGNGRRDCRVQPLPDGV